MQFWMEIHFVTFHKVVETMAQKRRSNKILVQLFFGQVVYHMYHKFSAFAHVTPLLTDPHRVPVITTFKTYQVVKGLAGAYIQKLIRPYTPARPLRSATSGRLSPTPVTPALLGHDCCLFCPRGAGISKIHVHIQNSACKRLAVSVGVELWGG